MSMPPPPEVIVKFASREGQLQRLFEEDETFREVCENYAECSRALDCWSCSTGENRRRVEEYRTMLAELETEIEGYLNASE